MKKIYADEIIRDIEELRDTIDYHGNTDISIKDKINLSNQLADAVEAIRRKYGLTSFYFAPAEMAARQKYKE